MSELSSGPWSFDLPDSLLREIGRSIALFSRLESAVLEAIWAVRQADLDEKKKIAKISAKKGFRIFKDYFAGVPEARPRMWDVLDDLANERNLMAHGVWFLDAGEPYVCWHSIMLESNDWTTAEKYTNERFVRFNRLTSHSLDLFTKLKSELS